MYKRILLAYDGSVEGRTALREGALIARRCQAQVFLLSVIAENAGIRLAEGAGGGAVEPQQEDQSLALLEDGVARLRRLGFEPMARLVVGEPAQQIAACADEFAADLVVVGHQRQSAFGRWWSGSMSAYSSDRVQCSVLVCRNVYSDEAFAAALAGGGGAQGVTGAANAPAGVQASASDVNAAQAHAAAAPAPAVQALRARRRRWTRLGLFLALPLALIIGAWFYVTGGQVVSLENAYVQADKLGISTDVSGTVSEIAVSDNQAVSAGQVLFRFDELPFRLALEVAQAQIGIVRDSLNTLEANYRDAGVQIQQGQDEVAYFSVEFERQNRLLAAHGASQADFDMARRNLQNAQRKLASMREQLAAIAAQLSGRPQDPIERNPRYLQAIAQRDEAARQLAHCIVRAPFAGIVTNVSALTPGKFLPASMTAFYLVATDHVWVQANPKETELTYLQPGQAVTVTADTYPGSHWRGTVQSISPAAAQAFALLPAQNTSGNWVKVVRRIPLRIRLETAAADQPLLRDGMSAIVHIETGRARGWPQFMRDWFSSAGSGKEG